MWILELKNKIKSDKIESKHFILFDYNSITTQEKPTSITIILKQFKTTYVYE